MINSQVHAMFERSEFCVSTCQTIYHWQLSCPIHNLRKFYFVYVETKSCVCEFSFDNDCATEKEMLENLKAEANHNLEIFKCMCVKHLKPNVRPKKTDHRFSN